MKCYNKPVAIPVYSGYLKGGIQEMETQVSERIEMLVSKLKEKFNIRQIFLLRILQSFLSIIPIKLLSECKSIPT